MNTSGFSSHTPGTEVIKWAWLDIFHLTDVCDVVLVSHPLPSPTQLRWYLKEVCAYQREVYSTAPFHRSRVLPVMIASKEATVLKFTYLQSRLSTKPRTPTIGGFKYLKCSKSHEHDYRAGACRSLK